MDSGSTGSQKAGFFKVVVGSFHSREVYRSVGSNEKGIRLRYLALLLALLWLLSFGRMWWDFSGWTQSEGKYVADQIPSITIRNGVVSADVETPYFIENPPSEAGRWKYFAVIDLTGKTTSVEDVDAQVLLTERHLSVRKSYHETRTFDLSGVEQFQMDRGRVEAWFGTGRLLFIPVLYPCFLVFSLAYRLLQVVIYGVLGIGFSKVLGVELPYPALVRLSVLAITPVLIVDTAFDLLKFNLPLGGLVAFVVAMAYLFFGVASNRPAGPVSSQIQGGAGAGTSEPNAAV